MRPVRRVSCARRRSAALAALIVCSLAICSPTGALVPALVPAAAAAPPGPRRAEAPVAGGPTAGEVVAPPPIVWRACSDGFRCGTLTVPLADADPGRTVDLAVIRLRARDRGARIGTLVVNPGGPGVPAVDFLRGVAGSIPGALRDRFDLVAFDPRGVGKSARVDCTDSLDPVFDQSFEPATAAERTALVAAVSELAQRCAAHDDGLLAHMSTADAVRDLERLRLALGQERISFVGYSYGTFLGASYADAYPTHVRAFVLDGPVDGSMSATAVALSQARGFERALGDFLADCSRHDDCAFHHRGHAAGAYDALRARVARAPLATDDADRRTLNLTRFDAAVLQALYAGRDGWPGLAVALSAAESGDASALLDDADTFVGRDSEGVDDHVLEAFWAVSCLDGPVVAGADAAARLEARAVEIAPRLGAFVVNNSLPCSVWPVPPVAPPARIAAPGAPPILVIGTTRDPATPLVQARRLADGLLRGHLLVAEGEQHTSFDNGNDCVDAAVTRFLVDRRLPRAGTRC